MARLLVIDDDNDFRKMLLLMLENAGYEVVEAENGKEAILFYDKEQIDLVVTDIFMPEKEGIETINELVKLNPKIKIIAISGGGVRSQFSFLSQSVDFGVQMIFEKPFKRGDFLKGIKKLLESDEVDFQ